MKMKKVLAFVTAAVMTMSMGTGVFAETETEMATEASSEADAGTTAEDLAEIFTYGYAGVSDDESYYVYLLTDDDVTKAMLVLLSEDGTQSGSFVGEAVMEDGMLTITDESLDVEMNVAIEAAEENGEDAYKLDLGEDFGTALVGQTDTADVIDCIMNISSNTEALF